MRRPVPSLLHALLAALLTVLLLGVTSPPSYAGEGHHATADRRPVRGLITFDKDAKHPWDSRIVWRAYRQDPDGTWEMTERREWRAGSGFGGPDTTHECVRDRGWLPNGRYSFVQLDDRAGNLIKGRVFDLGAKACRNGTVRHNLFIHTETGAGNEQCADTKGDQVCRWEWPKFNDYRSAGCIKMSPRDLLALTRHFHRYFDAGVRYPRSRVQVKVIS